MQSEFTYIWCVEYPHKYHWDIKKIKKYFKTKESAQLFVDNYSEISKNNDHGPCSWDGNIKFNPKVERQLGVTVEDFTYTLGMQIIFN